MRALSAHARSRSGTTGPKFVRDGCAFFLLALFEATTHQGNCRPPLHFPFETIFKSRVQLLQAAHNYESDSA